MRPYSELSQEHSGCDGLCVDRQLLGISSATTVRGLFWAHLQHDANSLEKIKRFEFTSGRNTKWQDS